MPQIDAKYYAGRSKWVPINARFTPVTEVAEHLPMRVAVIGSGPSGCYASRAPNQNQRLSSGFWRHPKVSLNLRSRSGCVRPQQNALRDDTALSCRLDCGTR